MKIETYKLRNRYREAYGIDYLREIFVQRLDDGLFARIGILETTAAERRESLEAPTGYLVADVWKGYEILVGAGDYAEVN